MKMSRILTIIAVVLVFMLTLTSCDLIQGLLPGEHQHSFVEGKCECGAEDPDYKPGEHTHNYVDGKCECGAEDPDYKPGEHTHNYVDGKCECGAEDPNYVVETTPVISVVPAELEIHAGDDIDLMFGVTVTDEGDEEVRLIIENDDDFDAEVEGVYTITYKAINKFGNEATATRKVTVLKALSALSLEVQKNLLGETKWQGTILNFKNKEYKEFSADTVLGVESGVFHNTSTSSITLSVGGGYGVAAVIDANGVVIEGRDGANGKVVNAANPVRSSSSTNLIEVDGEKVAVTDFFAQNLVIPAGGYAIVVQNGYCGTTVDSDGRGFMNYNVIGTYGNVVRLLWADDAEVLTPYVNQAPVISGTANQIYAAIADKNFALDAQILAGVTATDDNGTFDPSDDASVTITVNGEGFDVNTLGKYTITLTATDGTLTATASRVVEVTDKLAEVTIGDKSYKTLPEYFAIDVNVDKLGSYHFIIFTPTFRPESLAFTNGWGEAFVLNQYGQVVRIYDGANGKYYDADNKAGITDATKCTAADFWKQAYASLQEGEYLVIAPNGAPGNASRAFLLSNRTVGAQMTITGITFPEAPHACESKCEICGKCLDAECDKEVCAEKCPNDHAHVCKNACETCGKCQNADCTEEVCAEKCACHECESKCEHCGGCTDKECTQAACATKCQGHEGHMFVAVGTSKKYEAVVGMWAINETITTNTAASKKVWVFTKDYTGEFSTNGYGAAVVLDKYGKINRIYDGANAGYTDAASGVNNKEYGVTANNYATLAWESLQDGEILVVFPHDGDSSNPARKLGLDCRWLIGQKMSVTGVEFASETMTVQIGSKVYIAELGMWAINETITTNTAASKKVWVFTKDYTGDFSTNGYGAAVILDKFGRVNRIYDGANAGYTDAASGVNNKEYGVTANNYATLAWESLQDGEILVVFPHDGDSSNPARKLGLDCRWLIGQKMSITGFEFK